MGPTGTTRWGLIYQKNKNTNLNLDIKQTETA